MHTSQSRSQENITKPILASQLSSQGVQMLQVCPLGGSRFLSDSLTFLDSAQRTCSLFATLLIIIYYACIRLRVELVLVTM